MFSDNIIKAFPLIFGKRQKSQVKHLVFNMFSETCTQYIKSLTTTSKINKNIIMRKEEEIKLLISVSGNLSRNLKELTGKYYLLSSAIAQKGCLCFKIDKNDKLVHNPFCLI